MMISQNGKGIDQRGFTLMEIMMVCAIVGVLSLVTMQLMNVQIGMQENSSINEDLVTLSSQVLAILNDQEACTDNLSGLVITGTPTDDEIAQLVTGNGRVVMRSGEQFAASDIDINAIYIDTTIDDPTNTASTFHLHRAELVVDLTKTPEANTTVGVRRILKRYPLQLDYSIHQAYSMFVTLGTRESYVKELVFNQCRADFSGNIYVGHKVTKVFCNNKNKVQTQSICTGICQVKNTTDIRITRCL